MNVDLIVFCWILELEEKDESHLRCPEDTTSICSTSVRNFLGAPSTIYVCFSRTVVRRTRLEYMASPD